MKALRVRESTMGKSEGNKDAEAGAPRRFELFRLGPGDQAFPAISAGRRSRRKVA